MISWCILLKKLYQERAKSIFFKKLYSGCSCLLDLIAIFSSSINLHNFYWIPLLFIFILVEETHQFRIFYEKTSLFRSSCSQKFSKIGVFKNFAIFTRKQLLESFFNKVAELAPGILRENSWICLQDYMIQDFCNGFDILLLHMQPLKLILKNRYSDLCSQNPWKILLKKPIFSKFEGFQHVALLKINFFIDIFQGFALKILTGSFENNLFLRTPSGYVWILYIQ